MWVYRTRASFELTTESDTSLHEGYGSLGRSGTSSATLFPSSKSSLTMLVTERGSRSAPLAIKEGHNSMAMRPQSKWMQRKRNYNLKLEALPYMRIVDGEGISKDENKESGPRGQHRESVMQMLESFEKMMQLRMESCERLTRMVRNASTRELVVRNPNMMLEAESIDISLM